MNFWYLKKQKNVIDIIKDVLCARSKIVSPVSHY